MAVRTCKVTCRDPPGVEHTVEVSAQSVFEAVAQALRVFREYEWCDLALAASVVVRITQPAVEHRMQLRDFYNWLEAAGKSPAEMTLKCAKPQHNGGKSNVQTTNNCSHLQVDWSPRPVCCHS
jgi:hypothetical protein